MKSAQIFVLTSLLLVLRTSAISQAPNKAEIDQLKVQIDALKRQQALSQQIIDSLEKKIDAMEKAQSQSTPPLQAVPTQANQSENRAPITANTSKRAPQVQQRELFSENLTAAPRIDNVPINPDMAGFFHLGDSATLMRFGGYAKTDIIHDFKLPGNPDLFVTSSFPLEPVPAANSTNVHARQSRVSAEIRRPTPYGELRVYFENDFFGAGPTILRLRHLYGQVDNFLVGWTFSTFMDVDSFPDTVDFEGPGGGIFMMQPQFRYTVPITKANSIAFSVEKPTTDINITNPNFANSQTATPTSPVPDFVVRYRYETPKEHFQLGTVLRSVGGFAQVATTNSFATAHTFGWGLNLSGDFETWRKDGIQFQGAYGHGIGRYISDLTSLGADASLNAANHLEATPALGTFIAYQHYWKPEWRSTATYGYAHVQEQAGQPETFYSKTNYGSFNLIWNPAGSLDVGAEYMYGNLSVKNGDRGFGSRLQLSMKYDFFKWSKEAQ